MVKRDMMIEDITEEQARELKNLASDEDAIIKE